MNFSKIMEQAQKYLQYDMIKRHTDLPPFPESRAKLLYTFLSQKSLYPEHTDTLVLVASLAQMGLDTHDMVPGVNGQTYLKEIRTNQLRVLAGDYFSSCFYYLLSIIRQNKIIHSLANAVSDANRIKLSLYLRMKEGRIMAEEYLNDLVILKMKLFLPFSQCMQPSFRETWEKMLHALSSCEVLLEELLKIDNDGPNEMGYGYWFVREKKGESPKEMLMGRLEQQVQCLMEGANVLFSHSFREVVRRMAKPFVEYLSATRV